MTDIEEERRRIRELTPSEREAYDARVRKEVGENLRDFKDRMKREDAEK